MNIHSAFIEGLLAVGAILSLLYELIAIFSAWRYFRRRFPHSQNFTPPVSILKPVRGVDREAYENFASFCKLDYPEYEILFGVGDPDDPAIPIIQKLIEDFPERSVRLFVGSPCHGWKNKVRKLCHLSRQARYPILVISDSDIRVRPDYLRAVVAPFQDLRVGAVTCMYHVKPEPRLGSEIEAVGIASEFFPGLIVAWLLDGVKFTVGATMAVTSGRLEEIGGFESIADFFSDDLELGRRVSANGYRVEMIPYTVWTVPGSEGPLNFVLHQLRWAVGLRHSRPWGHLGRMLAQPLPWVVAATLWIHTWDAAAGFLGAYLALRLIVAWMVGVWGLKDPLLKRKLYLVPVWDAVSFFVWAASFFKNRIEWRGSEFYVRKGRLVPVATRQ